MTEKLEVGLGERSYSIWIGSGILAGLGERLDQIKFPKKVAIVTNPNVDELYGPSVRESLGASGFEVHSIIIPDGEQYKTLETLEDIFEGLIQKGFDRSTGLIALGGGVIGDITGFAAATYLRGIPFVQVPTTLLAQVDSSVGGKTAVNHRLGKNLVGAFYQPKHVHIDVLTLNSLGKRDFSSGMAEVIKYGVIRDRGFFQWLVKMADAIQAGDVEAVIHAVKRSCEIKANIVEIDERESSLRAILNLGHTYGHAVETLLGYGKVLHGEAVSIGMVVAAHLSCELGLSQSDDVQKICRLLQMFHLPVDPPDLGLEDCLQVMSRDKKVLDGKLRMVLNVGIGDCVVQEIDDLKGHLNHVLQKHTRC